MRRAPGKIARIEWARRPTVKAPFALMGFDEHDPHDPGPLDGGKRTIQGFLLGIAAGLVLWAFIIALIAWVFWG